MKWYEGKGIISDLVSGSLDLQEVKQWQVTLCILYLMSSVPWALYHIVLTGVDGDRGFHLLYSLVCGIFLFDFGKNYVEDYVCLSKIWNNLEWRDLT